MSRYCLDTSAYSHFKRNDPRVVELLDRAEWVGMPAITLGELRTGFLLGTRREQNEEALREFLDNPVVERLVADAEASRHYAEIVVDLRRAGTPIPTNDIWIAAIAAREGA
ncbi:MAG: type II toxin-antitoxin system VapC family toxin, partial [bacterium]